MSAPAVYNPGGLTLMIDDFCVENATACSLTGSKLLQKIKAIAKIRGASQILLVCAAHNEPKRQHLKAMELAIASEWRVGEIA